MFLPSAAPTMTGSSYHLLVHPRVYCTFPSQSLIPIPKSPSPPLARGAIISGLSTSASSSPTHSVDRLCTTFSDVIAGSLPSLVDSRSTQHAQPCTMDPETQASQEDAYFSELLSYSLERLSKEPDLLRADQEHLRRQIQDAAVHHYRSFIDTAHCLDSLRTQLAAAGSALDALAADLPKLQASGEEFRHSAAAINAKRADNRRLYSEWSAIAGAPSACSVLPPVRQ